MEKKKKGKKAMYESNGSRLSVAKTQTTNLIKIELSKVTQ